MLVAAGASLTMRDANGLTPMMIAFQVEDNDLATYLESECFLLLLFCHMFTNIHWQLELVGERVYFFHFARVCLPKHNLLFVFI